MQHTRLGRLSLRIHAAVGEFELRLARRQAAREYFKTALVFARNPMERQFFEQPMGTCERDAARTYHSGEEWIG
jgi:predicted RNA polymerase sigma factor